MAAACASRKWAIKTGCARRRCVYAGMRASPQRSASETNAAINRRTDACSEVDRRRRNSRRSSDTCSLRDRPVCSRRPVSPMRSTNCRSTKECTSSSGPATHAGSACPLASISVSAAVVAAASSADRTPAAFRACAHARLPITSSSNNRRSKRNDAPKSKTAALGSLSKRPDQSVDMGTFGVRRAFGVQTSAFELRSRSGACGDALG